MKDNERDRLEWNYLRGDICQKNINCIGTIITITKDNMWDMVAVVELTKL